MPPPDPLDHLLDRWGKSTPQPHDNLDSEVWRRIAVADEPVENPGLWTRLKEVFARPSFAITFAAACVLLALFLVERRTSHREAERNRQIVQSYLRLVDPQLVTETNATANPAANLDALLAWMQSDLGLNARQLARIKTVHEQLGPHMLTLADQVAQVRKELAAFEQARQAVGQIDFIEFAHYVDARRRLDRECADSTRRLVSETAGQMTPQQRQQYLELLSPALNKSSASSL